MTTTICFIRHGQTDQNKLRKIQGRRDFPLNDTGRSQALKAAKYLKLKDNNWDIIYSSPLSRATETAQILTDNVPLPYKVIVNQNFIERDFGETEGLSVNQENFKSILNNTAKGLEKSQDIEKRVYNETIKICDENEGKKILVVAHSHTIKALIIAIDKSYDFWLPLSNCCLNYFEYNGVNLEIKKLDVSPF
ncbi:MAG: histidine phosphatase family protein [Bacilli bacterium]